MHFTAAGSGSFFGGPHETIGGGDLARDNEASRAGSFCSFHILEAKFGYSRSTRYDPNTYPFDLSFEMGRLLRIAP